MTPTLLGRWQTRFFLLSTVGLVISLLVGWISGNMRLPLLALCYVLVVGGMLDVLYQYMQSFRWDCDWPTIFQVGAGVLEGLLVWFLIEVLHHFQLPANFPTVFLVQYGSIWLIIFVLTQGPLRLLWPKWRYQGGQWLQRSHTVPQTASASPQGNCKGPPHTTPLPLPLPYYDVDTKEI